MLGMADHLYEVWTELFNGGVVDGTVGVLMHGVSRLEIGGSLVSLAFEGMHGFGIGVSGFLSHTKRKLILVLYLYQQILDPRFLTYLVFFLFLLAFFEG
jgi:hypothetical protein